MVTIYHYEETTGTYIGQGVAPNNPADPSNPLIPAHSTTTPPPAGRVRYDAEKGDWVSLETATPEPLAAKVPEALEVREAAPETKTEEPEKVEEAPKAKPSTRSRKSRRK